MFLLAVKYSLIYYDKKLYYENIAWTAFVNVNITLNLRSYKENQFYTSINKKIYALLLLDLRQNFMTIFLILPKQLLINMLLYKKRKHSKHLGVTPPSWWASSLNLLILQVSFLDNPLICYFFMTHLLSPKTQIFLWAQKTKFFILHPIFSFKSNKILS